MTDDHDPAAPRYRIERVADFLAVPEDRIDDCLEEFARGLDLIRSFRRLLSAVAESQGDELPEEATTMPYWIWIDDGGRDATIRVKASDGEDS